MRRLLLTTLVVLVAYPLSATEPNPSLRQREITEKLLEAMQIERTMRSALESVYATIDKQTLEKAMESGDADTIAEAKELFAGFRERAAKIDFGGEMHEAWVRVYAKYFTEQEIIALTAFYSTPAGKKALELTPKLMEEGQQIGLQHLAPKIDAAMNEAIEACEKKRPWRRTSRDMRSVATAIEAWATDNEEYPSGDYSSLREQLVPTYLRDFPDSDMWDHEYAYVVSDDRMHYRLVSAGSDTIFEWDSRRITPVENASGNETPETTYKERLEDDLIFADGWFVQLPVQLKPKEE